MHLSDRANSQQGRQGMDNPAGVAWYISCWTMYRRGAYVVFTALLAAFAAWCIFRARHPEPPSQLLAGAFSAHRTLEFRFPGAVYAPLKSVRGRNELGLNRPTALLEAEAL